MGNYVKTGYKIELEGSLLSCRSVCIPLACCCEHDDANLISIERGEFLDQMSNYYVLNDFVAGCSA
jgi:hypothetical protein